MAAEPVAVRSELAGGVERDQIGGGRSHRGPQLCMSHRRTGFSAPRCGQSTRRTAPEALACHDN
jgi:hypothetical protein